MQLEIAPIQADCETRAFVCGVREIDTWFRESCHKRNRDHIVRTYTAHRNNPAPVGFYSLAIATEDRKKLPKKQRNFGWEGEGFPAVRIHYFAVQRALQRQGIGRVLMGHALEQAYTVAKVAGIYAVTLWAENEAAQRFYETLGFRAYNEMAGRKQMLLPAKSLIESFED